MTTLKKTLALVTGLALLALVAGLAAGWPLAALVKTLTAVGSLVAVGAVLDSRTEFADATALSTAATGLALIGNVIDLSIAGGVGANVDTPLYVVINVDTQPTSGGAATLGFVLASDAQAAIAVDGSATEHFRTSTPLVTAAIKGYSWTIAIPIPPPAYERYLGILQNVGVAALTAGKINAFLTTSPSAWVARPDALP